MAQIHSEEEQILHRIPKEIILLSFLLSLAALLLFDWLTGLFVLGGGILSALSFIWHKQFITKVFPFSTKKKLRSILLFYGLRLLLILATFSIIIFFFSKKIIAFAVGLSTIVPVFLIEAAIALSGMKKWKN